MTQITIRISDPEIEKEIRRKAKESRKSLNKVVIELIRAGAGFGGGKKKNPRGASLAKLAGGWTDQDAREFEEAIKIFKEIDEEMWK
jgi:xanthine dehydrogenase molybdopterin-binding subunit B